MTSRFKKRSDITFALLYLEIGFQMRWKKRTTIFCIYFVKLKANTMMDFKLHKAIHTDKLTWDCKMRLIQRRKACMNSLSLFLSSKRFFMCSLHVNDWRITTPYVWITISTSKLPYISGDASRTRLKNACNFTSHLTEIFQFDRRTTGHANTTPSTHPINQGDKCYLSGRLCISRQ